MEESAKNQAQIEGKNQGIFKAATWIAIIILFSKIVGFLRDVVIANYYGTGIVSDAYFYAYQIPALLVVILGGVGGPFHSATVAIFSKLIPDYTSKPTESVKKLFNTFETVTFIVFALLAILCFIFPDKIMSFVISSGSEELVNIASVHLKIMSPLVLIGAMMGIYYGILVTYKHYLLPNISPSFVSLGIIGVLLIFKNDATGIHIALGTLIGAILQFVVQTPAVRKLGYGFTFTLSKLKDANFKEITELLFPAFLSSTIGQFGLYVDMFFSSGLEEGAWTSLGYANRIFQFPTGLLLTAILVPLFPLFSRLVGEKKYKETAEYFTKGVGSLFFISCYFIALISIIRFDAITFALERGAFTHDSTIQVANILFIITFSLLPYVFRDSATRLLYAFNDSKIPFITALLAIFLKIFFNSILVKEYGIYGISMSTVIITLINAIILGSFIKSKMEYKFMPLFKELAKMVIIGVITTTIGYYFNEFISVYIKGNLIQIVLRMALTTSVVSAIYMILSSALKVQYASIAIEKIKGKFIK